MTEIQAVQHAIETLRGFHGADGEITIHLTPEFCEAKTRIVEKTSSEGTSYPQITEVEILVPIR